MALESATYIDGLVATNPAASDAISTADDHLRLIKSTLKNTFPNINGPITRTDEEINGLAPLVSPGFSGTPTAPTAAAGTNTTQIATTAFAVTAANSAFPSGGIIMWSGSIASIPSGWLLCNGSNGTPDLRDRFVVGAGSLYSVAATGGSKDAIAVSHTHTFSATTSSNGDHTHSVRVLSSGDVDPYDLGDGGAGNFNSFGPTGTAGAHTHTVSGTTDSTGSSGTNANLPPYYALAYIMKA